MSTSPPAHRRSRRPFYVALGVAAAAGLTFTTVGLAGQGGDNSANAASSSAVPQSKAHAPQYADDLNGDGHFDEVFTSKTGTDTQDGDPYLGIVYGSKSGPDPDKRVLFSQKDLGIPDGAGPGLPSDSRPTSGDLDGDGHPDLIVGPDATVVWGGAKGPQKNSPISKIQLPHDHHGDNPAYQNQPLTGDFDGDGHIDLADVRTSKDGMHVKIAVLHGPFTRDGKPARSSERSNPLANDSIDEIGHLSTGDANGDKATDLVVHEVSDDEDSSSVLLTGGAKTDTGLSDEARKLPEGNEVTFGDFDGDKRQDMVVGNSGIPNDEDPDPKHVPGWIDVFYGKDPGTAHRIKGSKKGDGFGIGLTPADVDGDGHDDLAVELGTDFSAYHAAVQVLHGSAKGLGSKPWHSTKRAAPVPKDNFDAQLYHAADVNGDGKDEIGLVDCMYIDPKVGFWYTHGTKNDVAKFSTAKFKP